MRQKQKKSLIKLAVEFVKLQLAGNVLFWGTLGGTFVFNSLLGWAELSSLVVASLIAHALFFIVDKQWVFADKKGRRKTNTEITRFVLFMGFNYFLNLAIIQALITYTPLNVYTSQFVSALFFTAWNFLGLRFWVFQVPEHHAITVHTVKKRAKRVRRAA